MPKWFWGFLLAIAAWAFAAPLVLYAKLRATPRPLSDETRAALTTLEENNRTREGKPRRRSARAEPETAVALSDGDVDL